MDAYMGLTLVTLESRLKKEKYSLGEQRDFYEWPNPNSAGKTLRFISVF